MKQRVLTSILSASVAIGLSACGGGTSVDTTIPVTDMVWAVDSGGYVNVFADDGDTKFTHVATLQPKNNKGGTLTLGEVHFNNDRAYVIIQSGLLDADGNALGGGVAVYDLKSQKLVDNGLIAFKSDATGNPSRIVHTYVDPNGNYLWLNNDGPSTPADPGANATTEQVNAYNDAKAIAAKDDSVFRLNWNNADANYLKFDEIKLGHGHKKGALSFAGSETGQAQALSFFAAHNGDESVSVVGNDPNDSANFLKVVKKYSDTDDVRTYSFKSTKDIVYTENGVEKTRKAKNGAHGMAFSALSGKFYIGITAGEDYAMVIVDAKDNNLAMTTIPVGDYTKNEIPAAGYVKASHDGKFVYTVGSKDISVNGANEKHSFLSMISAADDSVKQVLDLGMITASSFNISEVEENGHVEVKILIPSSSGGMNKNVIKVVTIDHETGIQHEGTEIETVNVGMAQAHRNGFAHEGYRFGYYPNGGDCSSNSGAHHKASAAARAMDMGSRMDCNTISVIDIAKNKEIGMFTTKGNAPGALGVINVKHLNMRVEDHSSMNHTH